MHGGDTGARERAGMHVWLMWWVMHSFTLGLRLGAMAGVEDTRGAVGARARGVVGTVTGGAEKVSGVAVALGLEEKAVAAAVAAATASVMAVAVMVMAVVGTAWP